MKKLLGIVVLGLLLMSGNAYAKPVLLECKEDEPLDQDQDFYAYYSLDFEKKNIYTRLEFGLQKIVH